MDETVESLILDQERRAQTIDKIRAQFPDVNFPNVVKQDMWWGKREHHRIDNRWGLVDEDTEMFYAMVSPSYQLVYHEEVVQFLLNAIQGLEDEFGEPEIKPYVYDNGAKIKVEAIFPRSTQEIKVGDIVAPKVVKRSSYDLSQKYGWEWGAMQLICSNGAVGFKMMERVSRRHIEGHLDISLISSTIREALIGFAEQTQSWRHWASVKLNDAMYQNLWEELPFGPRQREEIESLPGIGNPLMLTEGLRREELDGWTLYSRITQYMTHEMSDARRDQFEAPVARVFHRAFDN